MRIGVISDTHGLLRPEVAPALAGVDRILHLGDVGKISILRELEKIAPVTAIRGNIDTHGPNSLLPATEAIELAGSLLYLLHSRSDLDLKPEAASIAAVICGHSHKPSIEHHNGVLYLNPGSCGPRRFNLPITYALLHIAEGIAQAEILPLLPNG